MRFGVEHHFAGPMSAVAAVLADPELYLGLSLPDMNLPELLGHRSEGGTEILRLRYEFVGSLDPLARRLVGSGRLAWIQEVRIDRTTGAGALHFEAEKDRRRLHGSAAVTLSADGDDTVRRIDGDLVVAIPGIGRMVERKLVPGIVRRLDLEAGAVAARLR